MENRYNESNKVTIKSIVLNCILTVFKVFSGALGNSSAMIADGLHSASDVISSVAILIGNFIAKKPADKGHNYGHEKAETLVSTLLSVLLMVVSIQIGIQGVELLFNIDQIQTPTLLPLIASIVSILIKEYQYQITMKVAKKTNSPALKADAWHHRSDALTSIAAFFGIIGGLFGFKILDPIVTILVAVFVFKVGFDIIIKALNELLDASIEEDELKTVMDVIGASQGIIDVQSIKSRKHGPFAYLEITICVDGDISVRCGHDIANALEENIKENLELIKDVVVHVEPTVLNAEDTFITESIIKVGNCDE